MTSTRTQSSSRSTFRTARIYLPSEDGDIYVVKAGPRYELLAKNAMEEVLMAAPGIAGDMLIVRGMRHVFGIAEADKGR